MKKMVEFKRKEGESFENFLRRFNKYLQLSKRLQEARERMFNYPKRTKRKQKEYALVSKKLREKKEYLKKIGKLKDEQIRKW